VECDDQPTTIHIDGRPPWLESILSNMFGI